MALRLYDRKCTELPNAKLATLQEAVSGNIEIIPLSTHAIIAYANEEGQFRQDFMRNNGGELLLSYFGYRVNFMGCLGPIVIAGKNERALTASTKETLKAMYKLIQESDDPYEGLSLFECRDLIFSKGDDAKKLKAMAASITKSAVSPAKDEKKKKKEEKEKPAKDEKKGKKTTPRQRKKKAASEISARDPESDGDGAGSADEPAKKKAKK